jgi:hypothetical protein
MSEPPFPESTPPAGPAFDDAVRNAVEGLQTSIAAFEQLLQDVPPDAYTPGEWQVIENTARELESLVEQVQLEYDVAAYDSQAWYEIMQDLPKVTRMLGDTMLLMRDAQARAACPSDVG